MTEPAPESGPRKKAFEEIHDKIYSIRRVMTPTKPHMLSLGYLEACDDIAQWLYSEMLEMDETSLLLRPGSSQLALNEAHAAGERKGIERAARECDRRSENWECTERKDAHTRADEADDCAKAIRALVVEETKP